MASADRERRRELFRRLRVGDEVDGTVAGLAALQRCPPATRPAVWVTEYNLEPGDPTLTNPAQATYGHGVFVAADGLLLRQTPRVGRPNFRTAFGGAVLGNWQGDSKTSS